MNRCPCCGERVATVSQLWMRTYTAVHGRQMAKGLVSSKYACSPVPPIPDSVTCSACGVRYIPNIRTYVADLKELRIAASLEKCANCAKKDDVSPA